MKWVRLHKKKKKKKNQFEQLNQKLKNFKIELPSAVLAYQLLKNANMPKATHDLTRATVPALTFEAMKKQIKILHDQCAKTDIPENTAIEGPCDTFYGRYTDKRYGRYGNGWNSRGRGQGRRYENYNQKKVKTQNPLGPDGKPLQCHACKSIMHFLNDCPDKDRVKNQEEVHVQLFTKVVQQCFMEQIVSESLNCALLDSGCSSTVCGNNWLKCYTDTLPEGVDLQECASLKSFKFGPGDTFNSIKQVNIPVDIAGMKAHIVTDVVDCEIPLLLSKSSLKAADSQLDFVNDTVTMFGKEIALQHTSNGHYCVPLTPKQVAVNIISNKVTNVTFTVNDMSNKTLTEKKAIALKLHKQFGHPVDSNKLN